MPIAPLPYHGMSPLASLEVRGLAEDVGLLAEAIVDTVRESFLVLDHDYPYV